MSNNLTNSEIKKVFECCYTDKGGCDECPYYSRKENRCIDDSDFFDIPNRMLDLLNQYETKNSNLSSDLSSLQKDLTSTKAEVENLKEIIKVLRVSGEQAHFVRKDGKSPLSLLTAEIKAEAYKEFAERFKEKLSQKYTTSLWKVYCENINNLLNELVGDVDE